MKGNFLIFCSDCCLNSSLHKFISASTGASNYTAYKQTVQPVVIKGLYPKHQRRPSYEPSTSPYPRLVIQALQLFNTVAFLCTLNVHSYRSGDQDRCACRNVVSLLNRKTRLSNKSLKIHCKVTILLFKIVVIKNDYALILIYDLFL